MIKTSLPVIDREELGRIPLFGAFTPGQMLDLSHMLRRRKFARDDVIFHQGDDSESFYIIESGTVRIPATSINLRRCGPARCIPLNNFPS